MKTRTSKVGITILLSSMMTSVVLGQTYFDVADTYCHAGRSIPTSQSANGDTIQTACETSCSNNPDCNYYFFNDVTDECFILYECGAYALTSPSYIAKIKTPINEVQSYDQGKCDEPPENLIKTYKNGIVNCSNSCLQESGCTHFSVSTFENVESGVETTCYLYSACNTFVTGSPGNYFVTGTMAPTPAPTTSPTSSPTAPPLWTYDSIFQPSGLGTSDYFGAFMSMTDQWLIVGTNDNTLGNNAGALYIYNRSGSTFTFREKIIPDDLNSNTKFGNKLAISGDTIVVGAEGSSADGLTLGRVYVYKYNGTAWDLEQIISNDVSSPGSKLGIQVDIDGDNIVASTNDGIICYYTRSGSTWTKSNCLDDGTTEDLGKNSLLFYNNNIYAVGNTQIAVIEYGSGTLNIVERITTPSTDLNHAVLKVQLDRMVLSSPLEDIVGTNNGIIYTYTNDGSSWSLSNNVTVTTPANNDNFAQGMDMLGDLLCAGLRDDSYLTDAGAINCYLWDYENSQWSFIESHYFDSLQSSDIYGRSVILDKQMMLGCLLGYDSYRGAIAVSLLDPLYYTYTQINTNAPTLSPTISPTVSPTSSPTVYQFSNTFVDTTKSYCTGTAASGNSKPIDQDGAYIVTGLTEKECKIRCDNNVDCNYVMYRGDLPDPTCFLLERCDARYFSSYPDTMVVIHKKNENIKSITMEGKCIDGLIQQYELSGSTDDVNTCYNHCDNDSSCRFFHLYFIGSTYYCETFTTCNAPTTSFDSYILYEMVTPAPTGSPTAAPTPNPRVEVGKVFVTMGFNNSSKSTQAAKRLIQDAKTANSNTEYLVSGTDTITLPQTVQTGSGATDQELIDAIKLSRNCSQCTVTLSSGGRRLLSEDGRRELDATITAEITFQLDEAAFNELESSGNTLESQEFLDALAADLGVNSTDIAVTVVGSEVVVEVTLIATSTEENPLDESAIQQLQELQQVSSDAASTIVTEIGDGVVTVDEVDLCQGRTCSGRGVYTEGVTTAEGCVIETGVCACSGEWWGINCEVACSCENGGICTNSYCACEYPYYGVRCQLSKTTDCAVCF